MSPSSAEADPGTSPIQLCVLGEFVLIRGSTAIALSPRARTLLSVLALRADQFTGDEHLVAHVWRGTELKRPRNSLQTLVSEINRRCGQHLIRRTERGDVGGYRLDERVSTDRRQLSDISREHARGSVDAAAIAHGLALWRGHPWTMLDDTDGDVVRDTFQAREELEALRIAQARIMITTTPERVTRLSKALTLDHPENEECWGLLAESLLRCERRVEAARELDAARRALAEFGVEPGPALIEVERRVHDPVSTGTSPTPPAPPEAPFVGRRSEQQLLDAQIDVARNGGFSCTLLEGQPGLGKTTLAQRTADRHGDLCRVTIRCSPVARPLEPLVMAFSALDQAGAAAFVSQLVGRYGDTTTEAMAIRADLDAAATALAEILADEPTTLMFIDDLQAADEATATIVLRLLNFERPDGLAIILCGRPGPQRSEIAVEIRSETARHGEMLELERLTTDELTELAQLYGHDPDDVRALARGSGGSPLLASMALKHLEPGTLSTLLTPERVPAIGRLERIIDGLVRSLGADAGELLTWIALSGQPLTLDLVAEAAGLDHLRALDILEHAMSLGLVLEIETDRFDIEHALVTAALLRPVSATRINSMHTRIRDVLVEHPGREPWATIAHHALAATGTGADEPAAGATIAAAREALVRSSPADAGRLLRTALDRLDHADLHPALRTELLTLTAHCAALHLDTVSRNDFADRALTLARRHELPEHFARAALVRGFNWQQGEIDRTTLDAHNEALAVLADPEFASLRSQVLSNLAGMVAVAGSTYVPGDAAASAREASRLSQEALDQAERSGRPGALVDALAARVVTHYAEPGRYRDQIDLAERIADQDDGGDIGRWDGLAARCSAIPRLCLGDFDGFRQDRERLDHYVRTSPRSSPVFAGYVLQWEALELLMNARWDEARRLAERTLTDFPDDGNLTSGAWTQIAFAAIETGEGTAAIAAVMSEYAASQPGVSALRLLAALSWSHAGDAARSNAELDHVLGNNAVRGLESIPRDLIWPASLASLAEIAVLNDRRDLAEAIAGELMPWHESIIVTAGGLFCFGAAERASALVSHVLEDPTNARKHFSSATEVEALLRRPGDPHERGLAVELRRRAWQQRCGIAADPTIDGDLRRAGQLGLLHLLR